MAHPQAVTTEGANLPGSRLTHIPIKASSHRNREGLAGTVAVAMLLAGGRWISYLSVGPLYISDVLIGIAIVHAVSSRLLLGKRSGQGRGRASSLLVGIVVLATLIRLLTAQGDLRVAARDAAPFAYMAIAFLSTRAYILANASNRSRTVRLLHGALVVHFAWVALAVFASGFTSTLPQLGGSHVLEIRSDLDTALLGVLAGSSILRIRRNGSWLNAPLAAASLALALAMQSRAGLLACCACVVAALVMRPGRNDRTAARTVVFGAVIAVLLLALLPSSPAGQRMLATMDGSATSQRAALVAEGTVHARRIAWERVVTYTLDDPVRTLVGVGFGPDFMRMSDADLPLGHGLRSPHNYLLTSFARLGVIGLTTVVALLIVLLAAAVREFRTREPDELASMCVLVVISIFVIAMLGVVLESPFGAAPFFWAGGVLLARIHHPRVKRKTRGQLHA